VTDAADTPPPTDVVARTLTHVVGRRCEVELMVAALAADRHVVLEGPPGTGKSTLLRVVAEEMNLGFEFVEGNAELTPARLIGHFDPARVLVDGYKADVFVDGPLVCALRNGSLLYVEELNRVPEETLNVLITVMSERELHVPRLGRIAAAPGFRLVAAMNPFDAVGTARISSAIYDRVCRLSFRYQDAADEASITSRMAGAPVSAWLNRVVDLVRRTRDHTDIRIGSSVRGAIDMVHVARSLAELRSQTVEHDAVGRDAALVALSGRIRVREGCSRSPEEIITELFEAVFSEPGGDEGKVATRDNEPGATTPAASR
jgi:MoxR-like ATPase